MRADGRLGQLLRPLVRHADMAARLGHWDVALTAAEEARRLAEELGQPLVAVAADTVMSLVAAMRGDDVQAERLAAETELVAAAVGANITVALAQFGSVLARLATGRHADAYAAAQRVFDPSDPAYHPIVSSWLIADLAEAARGLGELDAARTRVAQVEALAGRRPGAWVALVLGHARALVADPADAGARFEEALANDLTRWPFQRARIQLAYGQWLRRERRIADSRAVLRAARDTFDALGCAPWSEQTRARGARSAHGAGAPDRAARRRGALQSRDRPAALPLAPDHQHAPVPRVPEARRHVTRRTACRAGPGPAGRRALTARDEITGIW
jgi:ATP/maltotriose-dependent transcriptional regulator MalT